MRRYMEGLQGQGAEPLFPPPPQPGFPGRQGLAPPPAPPLQTHPSLEAPGRPGAASLPFRVAAFSASGPAKPSSSWVQRGVGGRRQGLSLHRMVSCGFTSPPACCCPALQACLPPPVPPPPSPQLRGRPGFCAQSEEGVNSEKESRRGAPISQSQPDRRPSERRPTFLGRLVGVRKGDRDSQWGAGWTRPSLTWAGLCLLGSAGHRAKSVRPSVRPEKGECLAETPLAGGGRWAGPEAFQVPERLARGAGVPKAGESQKGADPPPPLRAPPAPLRARPPVTAGKTCT